MAEFHEFSPIVTSNFPWTLTLDIAKQALKNKVKNMFYW